MIVFVEYFWLLWCYNVVVVLFGVGFLLIVLSIDLELLIDVVEFGVVKGFVVIELIVGEVVCWSLIVRVFG